MDENLSEHGIFWAFYGPYSKTQIKKNEMKLVEQNIEDTTCKLILNKIHREAIKLTVKRNTAAPTMIKDIQVPEI